MVSIISIHPVSNFNPRRPLRIQNGHLQTNMESKMATSRITYLNQEAISPQDLSIYLISTEFNNMSMLIRADLSV